MTGKPGPAEPIAHRQIAALPIRREENGDLRVLMVTSRGTGRWVIPKGWTMHGKKPWRAAEIEALEEAGAIGSIASEPFGTYDYSKKLEDGEKLRVRVTLYPMVVDHLKTRWKERGDRTRRWFTLKGAARRVAEPELQEMLLTLAKKSGKQPAIRKLLKAS